MRLSRAHYFDAYYKYVSVGDITISMSTAAACRSIRRDKTRHSSVIPPVPPCPGSFTLLSRLSFETRYSVKKKKKRPLKCHVLPFVPCLRTRETVPITKSLSCSVIIINFFLLFIYRD